MKYFANLLIRCQVLQKKIEIGMSKSIVAMILLASYILDCDLLLADDKNDKAVKNKFTDIEIHPRFKTILVSNVLLMEVAGAKVVRLPGNRTAVVGVASTEVKKSSSSDRLRAEKVCRIKALANVIGEKQGVQVLHIEELKDETRVIFDDNGEKASSVSTLMQVTKTKIEGIAKDMPIVGRWSSANGEVFYLAIGVILDENGERIQFDN